VDGCGVGGCGVGVFGVMQTHCRKTQADWSARLEELDQVAAGF
jgi:hypothetical protein